MILSFKKFDNLLLYLSLKVGVNFMNSQHLRLKWHFEKLDKYGPWPATESSMCKLNKYLKYMVYGLSLQCERSCGVLPFFFQ